MKRFVPIFTAFLLSFTASVEPCPTCVGRLDEQTPPFFSSEYDSYYKLKPHAQSKDINKGATAQEDDQSEEEQS